MDGKVCDFDTGDCSLFLISSHSQCWFLLIITEIFLKFMPKPNQTLTIEVADKLSCESFL